MVSGDLLLLVRRVCVVDLRTSLVRNSRQHLTDIVWVYVVDAKLMLQEETIVSPEGLSGPLLWISVYID